LTIAARGTGVRVGGVGVFVAGTIVAVCVAELVGGSMDGELVSDSPQADRIRINPRMNIRKKIVRVVIR